MYPGDSNVWPSGLGEEDEKAENHQKGSKHLRQ